MKVDRIRDILTTMTHPAASHALPLKKNVKNSQAEITFIVLKCLCMCNCVSNFMTNEEQELAVRVLYPLAYYSTLSECPCIDCTVVGCIGVCGGVCVCGRLALCVTPVINDMP